MDDFELELSEAMHRRAAPPSLKRRILERRWEQRKRQRTRMAWLERIAASLVVAAVAGGAVMGHYAEERRKGEEAKQQVLTALRITSHALGQVSTHLEEHDRDKQ
jgi:hypothetical protein